MQCNCIWSGCIGRAILGLFFIAMGALNFAEPQTALTALAAHAVPHPDMILNLGIVIEIILGILIVIGRVRRTAAWILILLTLIIAVVGHPFWTQTEHAKIAMLIQFLSDIAIIGGLLLVASHKKHCEPHCEKHAE